jgi:hypothetical protein
MVGSPSAPFIAAVPPLWVRDKSWRDDVKSQLSALPNLNNSQRRAIAQAMIRSFTLWQGPPGTGKTATLLALIEVLISAARGPFAASEIANGRGVDALALSKVELSEARAKATDRWDKMGAVLACANTNAATDNILEGLAERRVNVVRVGQPAKVSCVCYGGLNSPGWTEWEESGLS